MRPLISGELEWVLELCREPKRKRIERNGGNQSPGQTLTLLSKDTSNMTLAKI